MPTNDLLIEEFPDATPSAGIEEFPDTLPAVLRPPAVASPAPDYPGASPGYLTEVARGLTQPVPAMVKTISTVGERQRLYPFGPTAREAADYLLRKVGVEPTPGEIPEARPIYKIGQWMEDKLNAAYPAVPEPQRNLGHDVATGVGQMATMIAGGAAAKALGASTQAATLIGTAIGFGQEFDDAFGRARQRGDDPDTAFAKSLGYATVAALIENKLGAGRIIRKYFPDPATAARKLSAWGISKSVGTSLAVGFGEEGSQRFAQNWIVEGKPSLEGVVQEGLPGGIVQAIAELPATLLRAQGVRVRRPRIQTSTDDQGQAITAPEATPAPGTSQGTEYGGETEMVKSLTGVLQGQDRNAVSAKAVVRSLIEQWGLTPEVAASVFSRARENVFGPAKEVARPAVLAPPQAAQAVVETEVNKPSIPTTELKVEAPVIPPSVPSARIAEEPPPAAGVPISRAPAAGKVETKPWEMTLKEFQENPVGVKVGNRQAYYSGIGGSEATRINAMIDAAHLRSVRDAIKAGNPVTLEVAESYPDLLATLERQRPKEEVSSYYLKAAAKAREVADEIQNRWDNPGDGIAPVFQRVKFLQRRAKELELKVREFTQAGTPAVVDQQAEAITSESKSPSGPPPTPPAVPGEVKAEVNPWEMTALQYQRTRLQRWIDERKDFLKQPRLDSSQIKTAKSRIKEFGNDLKSDQLDYAIQKEHRASVEQAIQEGKIQSHPDYPDLVKPAAKPTAAKAGDIMDMLARKHDLTVQQSEFVVQAFQSLAPDANPEALQKAYLKLALPADIPAEVGLGKVAGIKGAREVLNDLREASTGATTGADTSEPSANELLAQLKAKLRQQEASGLPLDDRLLEQIRKLETALAAQAIQSGRSGTIPSQPPTPASASEAKLAEIRAKREEIKARLRKKLGQTNVGVDPEVATIAAELAVNYTQEGVVHFSDFARRVKAELPEIWDAIKQYLRGAWTTAADASDNINEISKAEAKAVFDEIDRLPELPSAPSPEESAIRKIILSSDSGQIKSAAIRKLAEQDGVTVKEMQEAVELELVQMAHEISSDANLTPKEKFDRILDLYQRQPPLNARTSTSQENQAYSTPMPLSYAMAHALDIDGNTPVYDSTAGNGMQFIGGDLAASHANEINPERAKNLRLLGIGAVTENDGRTYVPSERFPVVKVNPPFGTIPNTPYGGYKITKLEHLIALKALEAINGDGRAMMILGAALHQAPEQGRGAQWIFENYLYGHYNVVGNFEVEGDLYAKQGASWPVRVIVINGRRTAPLSGELAPKVVPRLNNWSNVWTEAERLHNEITAEPQSMGARGAARLPVPDTGQGATPTQAGGVPAGTRPNAGTTTGAVQRPGSGAGQPASRPRPSVGVPPVPPGQTSGQTPVAISQPGSGGRKPATVQGTGKTGSAAPANAATAGGRTPETSLPGKLPRPGDVAGDLQSEYVPGSDGTPFGTNTPVNLADGTRKALSDLVARGGPITDFVADRLNMTADEVRNPEVFAAEQIDGVAMAIDQIETSGALIIGDETGIGKGRQAAGVIRYSMVNGKIPMFFTADPKLFSDMHGDLTDIHAPIKKPLIFGDPGKAGIVDVNGNVLFRAPGIDAQKRILENIRRTGWAKSGYDSIFVTYSQVNDRNHRQEFLEWIARENPTVVIMDESHRASGDSETSMSAAFFTGGDVARGKGATRTTIPIIGILNLPGTKLDGGGGVLYLSATYAKRPDNMPVYFRTKLSTAAQNFDQIVDAMTRGGVALQQAVSEALAQAGQYIRRERDFTGASFDMKIVETENRAQLIEQVDQTTDVLSEIIRFSDAIRAAVLAAGASGSTSMTQNQHDMSNFASVVHNQISQLLLAAKADYLVKTAIEAKAKGEKPVIALMNTMGSFLEHFVEDNNIEPGQAIRLRWNELLKYALRRQLRITTTLPNGDTEISYADPADYGLKAFYDSIEAAADSVESKFPVSPIDYIIQKLRLAGVKVVEMTGRTSGINYTDFENGDGTYVRFKQANKNRVVNGFNSGEYDGMLLNAAGSTGLSAHASKKFNDQRPRHMIIGQASTEINVFVQTLGRIRRTGMVLLGIDDNGKAYGAKYTHAVLPLQAELRPAAMTGKKLKSLNANSTADADSVIKIQAEDIFNKYGDHVVTEFLDENPAMQNRTRIWLEEKADGSPRVQADVARKFTGRMAIMPDADQQQAYEQILPAYKTYIEQLKAMGDYDLEIVVHSDWDGRIRDDSLLQPGTDESNIFTASLRVQNWEVNDVRHVPTGPEMVREFEKNLGSQEKVNADWQRYAAKTDEYLRTRRVALNAEIEKAARDHAAATTKGDASAATAALQAGTKAQRSLQTLDDMAHRWDHTRPAIEEVLNNAGGVLEINNEETGELFDGMLVNVRFPTTPRVSPGAFHFRFSVSTPGGSVFATGAQIGPGQWTLSPSYKPVAELRGRTGTTRIERYFVTGNPIAAYTVTGGRGRLTRFTADDGHVVTGLLMPRNWNPQQLANDPRLQLVSGAAASTFLRNHANPNYNTYIPIEAGGIVRIDKVRHSNQFAIWVPWAKATGGRIHQDAELRRITGDFTKRGSRGNVEVGADDLTAVADRIMAILGERFHPVGNARELIPLVERSNQSGRGGSASLAEPDTAALPASTAQPIIDSWRKANPTAPEVQTVNRPDWTQTGSDGKQYGVRGWWDGQKIIVNLAHVADAAAVLEVLNHELIHPLLDSAAGQAAIESAITQELGGNALARIQQRYKQGATESPEQYQRRAMAEWFAQLKETTPTLWQRIVARIREFLAKLNIANLSDEEVGRAMLRKLEATAERTAQLQAKNATVLTQPGLVRIGGISALTAYHGTPHKVDKFTTAKIGTGEGAQVYGWGLYFAEQLEVADTYKRLGDKILVAGADARNLNLSDTAYDKLKLALNSTNKSVVTRALNELKAMATTAVEQSRQRTSELESRKAQIEERISKRVWTGPVNRLLVDGNYGAATQHAEQWTASDGGTITHFPLTGKFVTNTVSTQNARVNTLEEAKAMVREGDLETVETNLAGAFDRQQRAERLLDAVTRRDLGKTEGSLYIVTLNATSDELLDWDRPLVEQSEKVQAAVRELFRDNIDESVKGAAFLARADGASIHATASAYIGDRMTSEALARRGIKGIRYLDQGSRKPVYEVGRTIAFGNRAEENPWEVSNNNADGAQVRTFKTKQEAQQFADGLNAKYPQTYNYVIFSDADITITHENGQPVSMAQAMSEQGAASLTQDPIGQTIDPATGEWVDAPAEGAGDIVQIAGIEYNIVGKERLTPEQKSAADTRAREFFRELNLPGENDLSDGKQRGATDTNLVFKIEADGENHDEAGERLLAHLTEQIQMQHQPGGNPAYVSSLVNALNKNFNVGNLQGVFSDGMIQRLMEISVGESSWRGTMLRAVTGITEDMATVARNATFFLRRTYENMFGGDLTRKIMDRIALNFRERFTGEEIERLYNENPILQELFLKVVARLKVKPSLRDVIQEIFATPINRQDDIVERFVDTMVNKFSATPSEAARLKAEFSRTFEASFNAARKKAQEKALASLLPEERKIIGPQTQLWKKLTDLVNSGWFDSAKVVEEYARSKGMKVPTEAEIKQMRDWSIREQELRRPTEEEVALYGKQAGILVEGTTLEKRQDLLRKMNTQWSRWTHPVMRSWRDLGDNVKRYNSAMAANEWLTANLLLKLGFGSRQVIDVGTQMILHTPTRAAAYAFEQWGNDKSAGRDSNLLNNLSQAMTDAYKTRIKVLGDTLASFKRTLAGKGEQKNVEQLISSIAVFDRMLLKADEMKAQGRPAAARFLHLLALTMRFGRQFAAAADVIQGVPAEAQEMAHQIRTGLREQGKSAGQQELEFNTILGLLTTARTESLAQARQILESRGLDINSASIQRAAWHILREKIYSMARTAGLPADEWKIQNHYYRNVLGWNEPETQGRGKIGGLGGLVALTAQGGKEVMSRAGLPAFPFVFGNAMGISLNRKLAYTPLGLFPGFFKGSPWFEGERNIRQRKIEAIIGTTTGATLMMLAALGVFVVLPRKWPDDEKEKAKWTANGWQPNMVIIPVSDTQEMKISTRVGPMSLLSPYLAAGGAFHDALVDREKKQQALNERAAKLGLTPEKLEGLDAGQWLNVVGSAAYASAVGGRTSSGMLGSYTDFGTFSAKKSGAAATSTLIPGLPGLQEVSRMAGANINPKLASFWDLLVPLPTSDANRVNMLGDPMRNENDFERIFQVLSGGTAPLPANKEQFNKNRAYTNLFTSDFRPPAINPSRGYQFGDELRSMTDSELQKYTALRGKRFSEELQTLDPATVTKEAAQAAFQRANAQALSEIGAVAPRVSTGRSIISAPSASTAAPAGLSPSRTSRGRSGLFSTRRIRLSSGRTRVRRLSTRRRRGVSLSARRPRVRRSGLRLARIRRPSISQFL